METLQQQKTPQKANFGNRSSVNDAALSYPSRTIVHAKLEMTTSGDHDEQEADAAANDIVSGGKIRRKISNGGSSGTAVSPQVESQIAQLQGGGHAMPAGLRNMMENGFGRDFSQVRLHTDSQAADMSSSISARAFTHGNDIYFNRGQFSPSTSEGQRLVAHELTHVAQGTGKVGRKENASINQATNRQVSLIFYGKGGVYWYEEKKYKIHHDVGTAYRKSAEAEKEKQKNSFSNVLVFQIETMQEFFNIIESQEDNSIVHISIYSHGSFDQIILGGFDKAGNDIDIHIKDLKEKQNKSLLHTKINENAIIELWGCNEGNDSDSNTCVAQVLADAICKPNVKVTASTTGTQFPIGENGHHIYNGTTIPVNGGYRKDFYARSCSVD